MTPVAYFYISMVYFTIAGLSFVTLTIKGYNAYKNTRYIEDSEKWTKIKPVQYILHGLHIPPYIIAAYWYYDSYIQYKQKLQHEH